MSDSFCGRGFGSNGLVDATRATWWIWCQRLWVWRLLQEHRGLDILGERFACVGTFPTLRDHLLWLGQIQQSCCLWSGLYLGPSFGEEHILPGGCSGPVWLVGLRIGMRLVPLPVGCNRLWRL